jgi:hypothetical protein
VTNALLAALLTYVGDRLGVPLSEAAIVAFGVRLFSNLGRIRRLLLTGGERVAPAPVGDQIRPLKLLRFAATCYCTAPTLDV